MKGRSLILALNETRKTLLASRLLRAQGPASHTARLAANIRPGDGIWVEDCNRVDTDGIRVPLDLLFLDSEHRVVATVTDLRPGVSSPEVQEATGVLELAAGTIRQSQTEKGDSVVLEPIVPIDGRNVAGAARSSRS